MDDVRQLGPSAVSSRSPEVFDGLVLDNATAPGQEVRCTRSSDPQAATDPMPWTPYSVPAGWFYPKRGDRAVLGYPVDGPPVILEWWPAADAAPDVSS